MEDKIHLLRMLSCSYPNEFPLFATHISPEVILFAVFEKATLFFLSDSTSPSCAFDNDHRFIVNTDCFYTVMCQMFYLHSHITVAERIQMVHMLL